VEFCAAGDFVPVLECDMAGLLLVFDEAMVNPSLARWMKRGTLEMQSGGYFVSVLFCSGAEVINS
jgi:hypothetical protein